ncbi:hypothetical protein C8R43DRAFT_246511 [Mycena crocata]|nr:hypothetical protein C8R43DRAFT_246511 [Mycena crocata]
MVNICRRLSALAHWLSVQRTVFFMECTRPGTIKASSPRLHTLNLSLHASRLWRNDSTPSWDAYTHLISTINQIRFPALMSIQLSVALDFFEPPGPKADLSPFLIDHPLLTDITWDMKELRVPKDSSLATSLIHGGGQTLTRAEAYFVYALSC